MDAPLLAANARERNVGAAVKDLTNKASHDLGSAKEIGLRLRNNNQDGCFEQRYITFQGSRTSALWCKFCKTHVDANLSRFTRHVRTPSHVANSKEQADTTIQRLAGKLHDWRKTVGSNVAGNSNKDDETDMFRFRIVLMFMRAAIPLDKINTLAVDLESLQGRSLTDVSHLRKIYIPAAVQILIKEVLEAMEEPIRSKVGIFIIFDGSTRVDNHLCIIVRIVTKDMKIRQYVITLDKYAECKNADHLVTAINRILVKRNIQYSYDNEFTSDDDAVHHGPLIGANGDSCSVNEKAKEVLVSDKYFHLAELLHCLAHYLTHIGEYGMKKAVRLTKFLQDFIGMMNSLGGASRFTKRYSDIFHVLWADPGNTRWWAKFEVVVKLSQSWESLVEYIDPDNADEVAAEPAMEDIDDEHEVAQLLNGRRIQRLRGMFSDMEERAKLRLEMDTIAIVCEPIIKCTYTMEGDGPVSLVAYDILMSLVDWFDPHKDDLSFPNLQKCITKCVNSIALARHGLGNVDKVAIQTEVDEIVRDIVDAQYQYFQESIVQAHEQDIEVYRACKLMNPIAMRHSNMNAETFADTLKTFKRFQTDCPSINDTIDGYKREWSKYIRMCSDIPVQADDTKFDFQMDTAEKFWQTNYIHFNCLHNLARFVISISPSSGAPERAFSILKGAFTLAQLRSSLQDYVMGVVMAIYNDKPLNKT